MWVFLGRVDPGIVLGVEGMYSWLELGNLDDERDILPGQLAIVLQRY